MNMSNLILGLLTIVGGIYGYLIAVGAAPRGARNSPKMELWRRKNGPWLKLACP